MPSIGTAWCLCWYAAAFIFFPLLTNLQNYDGNINKLKSAYRVFKHFNDADLELLKQLNEDRDLDLEDPWSFNKLQSIQFLTADQDIRHKAMRLNAKYEIASEIELNTWCAKEMVKCILGEIAASRKLDQNLITVDAIENVCKYTSVMLLLQPTLICTI